jgi:hypothetical protein
MDPVTLVIAALAAGASSGLQNAATDAVKDLVHSLREKVRARLSRRAGADALVDRHSEDPETWQRPMEKELSEAGVDSELVDLAKQVLSAVDPEGSRAGKYQVTVGGNAQGTVVGDAATVHMVFGAAPPAPER